MAKRNKGDEPEETQVVEGDAPPPGERSDPGETTADVPADRPDDAGGWPDAAEPTRDDPDYDRGRGEGPDLGDPDRADLADVYGTGSQAGADTEGLADDDQTARKVAASVIRPGATPAEVEGDPTAHLPVPGPSGGRLDVAKRPGGEFIVGGVRVDANGRPIR